MPNVPDKPVIDSLQWINGTTKLNNANLTHGINANLASIKAAVDGIIDALGGGGADPLARSITYTNYVAPINAGNSSLHLCDRLTNTCLECRDSDVIAWKVFTAKYAVNVDGVLFAGGGELRFGGQEMRITDNGVDHAVIITVNRDYVNFWRQATFLSNVKISAQNDADPPIFSTNFDREGGWAVFGRGVTFNGSAEYNGLIWTGGREIRFPDYVDFKDNTNAHNVVMKVDQNYVNFEKVATFKAGANIDVQPTEPQHAVRKDYVDSMVIGSEITGVLNTANFTENGAGYYRLYYTPHQMILTVASRVLAKQTMPAGNGDTYDFVDFTIPESLGNKLYPIHSPTLQNTGTLRNMAGAFNTGHPGYWLRIRKVDSTHIRVQIVTTVGITDPIEANDNMQIADSTTFIL